MLTNSLASCDMVIFKHAPLASHVRPNLQLHKVDSLCKEQTMSIQIRTRPATFYTYECSTTPEDNKYNDRVVCSPREYGFDFDEDELARELIAPIPAGVSDPPCQSIEADEFEMLYKWFSS